MLKTKVMEDLDALLADLQSTTSHISSYQEAQGPPPPPPLGDSAAPLDDDPDSRESTPPPLPPPPTADVLGDLNDEPLYEPQDMRHQSQGNARSTPPGHQGLPPTSPASFTAPPPPSHPPPPVSSLQSPVASSPLPPKPATKPKPAPKPVSMLTNNLSELDMLLQDLSSAQFMAEVDRRNAANIMSNNGASESGAPVVPAGGGGLPGDRSVNSLLIELENTLPPGRPGMSSHMSMESMSSHYEAVRPRQAQIPPHGGAPARPPTQASPGPRVPMMAGPMPMSAVIGAAAGRQTASTATRELDDLMASLSDFKVSGQQVPQVQQFGASPYAQPHKLQQPQVSGQPQLQHVGEPPYAQPHKLINKTAMQTAIQPPTSNASMTCSGAAVDGLPPAAAGAQAAHDDHLETMLGNLSTDMSRQGIMTIPKGHCAACAKPIVGQVITALGRIWHPEHFTCSHCKEELGTRNFFERDGVPYCERDYHNLFSPRCGHCNGPILDKCVTALDKTWHPEHFFCAQCGRLFADDGFHEKDGHAYCREDYFELFAPKCGGCRRPIMDNYISALNRQWHPECFICTDCHMPFGGGSFFDHEGMPYCETHYHAKRGSLCAGCMKPITGRCITAMYKKFHPEHFVCAFCLKQLNKGTFKEQNEKPYCHPCFIKLFG